MINTASKNNQTPKSLIESFSLTQLNSLNLKLVRENALLELLTCSFFVGAEQQLRKQSGLNTSHSKKSLIKTLMRICKLGEIQTTGLIHTVNELAKKYYLIENTKEQGEKAAEQWLNCVENPPDLLKDIIFKHKNLTLFELGIEGLNESYLQHQANLYSSTDDLVRQLRKKALFILLPLTVIITAILYYVIRTFN